MIIGRTIEVQVKGSTMAQKVLYGVMKRVCKYSELYDQTTHRISRPELGEVICAYPTELEAKKPESELNKSKNILLSGGYYQRQESAFRELKDTRYYIHPVEAIPVQLSSLRPS